MLSSLRGFYADALTSISYLGLLAFALHANDKKGWLICLSLVALIGFFAWASTFVRVRAIADIATSRIASAAQGYVELHGRASTDTANLIRSPLSATICVWFRYWVYEKTDDGWRETDSGVSDSTFEIKDSTGSCVVDPDYAEVIAAERRVSHHNGYKYVEDILYASSIYVLGEFSTIGGANSVLSVKDDFGFLLAEWKKDPVNLKKRFDLDGNGEIDLQEWELARRAATREIEKQHREIRKETGVNIIRAPRDKRLFLLSSLSPQKLRQRYLWWSLFHLLVCFAAAGALLKFSF
jgi:uncharacterized membrane protein YhaH (DUF805 family)